jgi:serine/threonine-protein kinase
MTTPDDLRPGDEVGPYTIQAKLGSGGMGAVYLARHRHLQRPAAIKILLPELSTNPEVVSRFFTEARATALIRHPGIVEVFDCDVLPSGRAYIVMEYLEGESLGGHLGRARRLFPDVRTIAAITGMIAEALEAAHGRGIAHRDLKPDNVFLAHEPAGTGPFVVKILDFGIAKLLAGRDTGISRTRTGSLLGTPIYMSPEQCRGLTDVDHRSDLYSLGCILFEMICGRPPFVHQFPGDLLMAHVAEPPAAVRALEPEVPPELDALVAALLAKDPAARPQSAGEVVAAMAQFLGVRRSQLSSGASFPEGPPPWGATISLPTPAYAAGQTPFPRSPLRTPPRVTPPPNRTGDDTTFTSAIRTRSTVASRRRWLLALPVLLLGAGALAYQMLKPEPRTRTRDEARAVEPPPPPAPPAPVTFTVQSVPPDAEVTVAGRALGKTPISFKLPRGDRELELVVRAPGHKESRRSLAPDRDRELELTLQPEARPSKPMTRKPPRKKSNEGEEIPFAPVGD